MFVTPVAAVYVVSSTTIPATDPVALCRSTSRAQDLGELVGDRHEADTTQVPVAFQQR